MTDPLFTHLYGSVPEDAAPKAPGLTPTITLPVTEYEAKLAQARADGMRAELERFKARALDEAVELRRENIRMVDQLSDRVTRIAALNSDLTAARRAAAGNLARAEKAEAERDAALAPTPAVPADAGLEDAADRLGAWLSAALDDPNVCDAMKADIQAWFAALRARPTPAPVGEPVAWRRMNESGTRSTGVTDLAHQAKGWRTGGYEVQPLYTHPTPAPQLPPEVLRQVVEALRHGAANMPHPDQCIDAALAAVQPYVEGV